MGKLADFARTRLAELMAMKNDPYLTHHLLDVDERRSYDVVIGWIRAEPCLGLATIYQ